MEIPISAAEGQLANLVSRAEAGDEIILTREGRPVARLAPVAAKTDLVRKTALIEAVRAAASKAKPGPGAARSQDFLYDEDGLPG